jgi:hypothetical protein
MRRSRVGSPLAGDEGCDGRFQDRRGPRRQRDAVSDVIAFSGTVEAGNNGDGTECFVDVAMQTWRCSGTTATPISSRASPTRSRIATATRTSPASVRRCRSRHCDDRQVCVSGALRRAYRSICQVCLAQRHSRWLPRSVSRSCKRCRGNISRCSSGPCRHRGSTRAAFILSCVCRLLVGIPQRSSGVCKPRHRPAYRCDRQVCDLMALTVSKVSQVEATNGQVMSVDADEHVFVLSRPIARHIAATSVCVSRAIARHIAAFVRSV